MSQAPSFYVENPLRTDATMAPPGHSSLYVLLPATHQHPNVDWNNEKACYRGVALRQLEKLGIADIEKRIRFERVEVKSSLPALHAGLPGLQITSFKRPRGPGMGIATGRPKR